jgi:hypothetical protein
MEKGSSVKKIDQPISAVITFSANESGLAAVQSVLNNANYFSDVHIVKPLGYDDSEEHYPGWREQETKLRAADITIHTHSHFDSSRLHTDFAIMVTPDTFFKTAALASIMDDIKAWPSCDNFAVASCTIIKPKDGAARTFLSAFFSYGFLLVLLALDTWRHVLTFGQYHRTVDLRGVKRIRTYPNVTYMAPHRWWTWWVLNGICYARDSGAACQQIPHPRDQGWPFVLRTIKTHRHMSVFGLWVLGYAFYYWLFAFPWWSVFMNTQVRWMWWLHWDVTSRFWLTLALANIGFVGWISWLYMELPFLLLPLYVFTFPVWLAVSPIVFFYGRIYRLRLAVVGNVNFEEK